MEKNGNRSSALHQEISALNEQYEDALKNGEEFNMLKDIRDKIRLLKLQLPPDGTEDPNEESF